MNLVLIRHATRSAHEVGDASLSAVGLGQANRLPEHVAPRGRLPKPDHLFASPKKRARSTLQPLCEGLALPLRIIDDLDERHSGEPVKDFEARVHSVLADATKRVADGETVYLCSHLDWLEVALWSLPSDLSENESVADFVPSEYRVFELKEGVYSLVLRGSVPPA